MSIYENHIYSVCTRPLFQLPEPFLFIMYYFCELTPFSDGFNLIRLPLKFKSNYTHTHQRNIQSEAQTLGTTITHQHLIPDIPRTVLNSTNKVNANTSTQIIKQIMQFTQSKSIHKTLPQM